jgi:hypothetical protein
VCARLVECPLDAIPEAFGQVEGATGGVQQAFPSLRGALHKDSGGGKE